MARVRGPIVVALVWLAALAGALATWQLTNDHFGRISPAWHIAALGELPFRDYFDPGYFMTELASAALLRLFGPQLLGEALLNTACIATGAAIVFVLARRASHSVIVAAAAALLTPLAMPRAYDYDKCLFYPLGILLCWRYVDRPDRSRLFQLAGGIVAAAAFRYDNGVFLALAAFVAVAIVHGGAWRAALGRVGLLAAAVALLALPFLVFVELHGGLADAIDQVVTYARRESARTRLSSPPALLAADLATGAGALAYYAFRLLPLAAGVVLLARATRSAPPARPELARITALIALCVLLNVFILRDPVGARIGGVAGPALVLAAWLAGGAWTRHASGTAYAHAAGVALAVLAVVALVAASPLAARGGAREVVRVLTSGLAAKVNALSATPPPLALLPTRGLGGLAAYLQACTRPGDRVFTSWFAPDLYFFAQRGFAGRIAATFGGHWSEPRFERRTIAALASQPVPVVIVDIGSSAQFRADYPALDEYIQRHYRTAAKMRFGADEGSPGYRVLVREDRPASGVHAETLLPCFAGSG